MSRVRAKRNKIFCILITLLVFISGMYFEDIKADSVFASTPGETTNSYIPDIGSVTIDTQVCTTEMLAVCGNMVTGQFTIRFVNQRRDTRVSPDFLCQNIFSLNEGKSYASIEEVQLISKSQDELIANYVHKSDGKKRIY